jgi:hypothetical protein
MMCSVNGTIAGNDLVTSRPKEYISVVSNALEQISNRQHGAAVSTSPLVPDHPIAGAEDSGSNPDAATVFLHFQRDVDVN